MTSRDCNLQVEWKDGNMSPEILKGLTAMSRGSGKTYNSYNNGYIEDLSEVFRQLFFEDKPVSVLENSEIGRNLHQLLQEKDHPLTNTALAYIKELERKMEIQEKTIVELEEELNKWETKKHHLISENKSLKQKINHPSFKRR
jgi:hypothetical protein